MDVEKAKESISSQAFVKWMSFFHHEQPGGPRTPEEEKQDLRAASLYALTVNCHLKKDAFPVSTEDFLMYPVERKIEDRMANAVLMMEGYAAAHNNNFRVE